MNIKKSFFADAFNFKNKIGWIIYSEAGLHRLILPNSNNPQPVNTLYKKNTLTEKINKYFLGKNVDLSAKIDLSGYTDFEKKVLLACLKVNYGKITSYKKLAISVGNDNAYRAVANTMKKNRLPVIIPCHRIIRENGDIGGYNFGTKYKKELLELEHYESKK